MKKNDSLSYTFVLDNLLKEYREYVFHHCCEPLERPKGFVFSKSGEPSPNLFYLLRGIVKVSVLSSDGYERILGYHSKNTFFALDSLAEGEPVIVTTTAVTDVSVIPVGRNEIPALIEDNAGFGFALLCYYSSVLKLMCYEAEAQCSSSVKTRLINFLALYMQSEEYLGKMCVTYSQSTLASIIGASRPQVARVCAELKEDGIIQPMKRGFYITDPEKLSMSTTTSAFVM